MVEARVQLDLGRISAWIAWQRLIVDCGKAALRVAIVEGGDDAVDGIAYAHEDLVLAGDAGPIWWVHVNLVQVDARPSAEVVQYGGATRLADVQEGDLKAAA